MNIKNKKKIIYITLIAIFIFCIFIAGIIINNFYQKDKIAKNIILENQRLLLEKTLNEQKEKIDKLESDLIDTKKEQSKIVSQEKKLTTEQIVNSNSKYVVAVACNTTNGISLGSGVIIGKNINNNYLILTNYHVIDGFYDSIKNPSCIITPYHGTVHYALPVYPSDIVTISEMKKEDWAFLEITNLAMGTDDDTKYKPTLSFNSFPKICSSEDIKMGSEIVVLGYPSIGSNTIAGFSIRELIATEGIVSSSPIDWKNEFTISAKIDHGSSGGGGFLKSNGCYAGIPSSAISGEIESLGRLINIPSLNLRLNNFILEVQWIL